MIKRKLLKQSAACVLGLSLLCAADSANIYAAQMEETLQTEEQSDPGAEDESEDSGIAGGQESSEWEAEQPEVFDDEISDSTVQNDGTPAASPEKSDETAVSEIPGTDSEVGPLDMDTEADLQDMVPEAGPENPDSEIPEDVLPDSGPLPVLDGWSYEGEHVFYYQNGVMAAGCGLKIEGYWYYFNADGTMLKDSWRDKAGEKYYYDAYGHLAVSCEMEIDGSVYCFGTSGAVQTGWQEMNGNLCYYKGDGAKAALEGLKIDGYWYYFDADGSVMTDWWRDKAGERYYYDSSGYMASDKGLRNKEGDWYYYDESGHLVTSDRREIDGYYYIFQESGAAFTGFLASNGPAVHGYDEYGRWVTGRGAKIDGFWYYFDEQGFMQLDWWREKNGDWYYYDTEGHMAADKGLKIEGYWYYFDRQGVMQSDWWREKNGGRYYYDAEGHMVSSRGVKIGGYWYYFTESGEMHKGWRTKGSQKFYYDSQGRMVAGRSVIIDGREYQFAADGSLMDTTPQRIEELKSYTYVPYVSGGTTPSGWDCSGFTQWALQYLGVSIPRLSYQQAAAGTWVNPWDMSSWKQGDILVYSTNGSVSHVALYLGDGMLMHSLNERYGTLIQSVEYYERWDGGTYLSGVRRYL